MPFGKGSKRVVVLSTHPDSLNKREKKLKRNILKTVKKLPEPKYHYTSQVAITSGSSGNIYKLIDPAQGTTSQERNGDRCTVQHLSLRGRCYSADTTGGVSAIRMIVFKWNVDTAERIPTIANILQATYAASSWTPFSPVVTGQERDDISIIVDKTFNMSYYGETVKGIHVEKKLNHKVYFNAGATTGKNQLHVLFVSGES